MVNILDSPAIDSTIIDLLLREKEVL